jgi:Pentapeptide repeats (8 copies)
MNQKLINQIGRFSEQALIVIIVSLFVSIAVMSKWNGQQRNVDDFRENIKQLQSEVNQDKLKMQKDVVVMNKDLAIWQNEVDDLPVKAIGGLIFVLASYVGYRNLKIVEDKQITDRLGKAIDSLGSTEIEIRLFGVYMLEKIGIDSPVQYHWIIVELLCAFIRKRCPLSRTENIGEDTVAALVVIGRRNTLYDPDNIQINLKEVNLEGIEIKCYLNLKKAILSGSNLRKIKIRKLRLDGANLIGSDFTESDLTNVSFRRADLREVKLDMANVTNATFGKNEGMIDQQMLDLKRRGAIF